MLGKSLALGLALALPAATALFALAQPIVSVLFEYGRFGAADRERTAAALAAFAFGLPFAVVAKVFGQVYFARQAPRWPLLSGGLAVLVAALAGLALAGLALAGGRNAAEAAAWAASLAFIVQALLLGAALIRDRIWRPSAANLRPILASLVASLVMLSLLPVLTRLFAEALTPGQPMPWRMAALLSLCGAGLAVYGAAGWLLGAFGPPRLGRYLRKRHG